MCKDSLLLIINIMKHCRLKIFTCNLCKRFVYQQYFIKPSRKHCKNSINTAFMGKTKYHSVFQVRKIKIQKKWFKQGFTANQCLSRKKSRSFPYGFHYFNEKMHNNVTKKSVVASIDVTDACAPMVITRSNIKH